MPYNDSGGCLKVAAEIRYIHTAAAASKHLHIACSTNGVSVSVITSRTCIGDEKAQGTWLC